MTCRIERRAARNGVVLRVSGRIEGAYVAMLRESIRKEKAKRGLAIDLAEVTLVSQDAVDALADAEDTGVELRDCPAYIREWVSRAKTIND